MREVAGPPGATAVLLLHGLTAVADLNWFGVFEPLGREFRVVSAERLGPAVGGLEELADDAVAVADALGIDRFVVVGYSMGGAVAQLVWRRHPARVVGLVLCATAARFAVTRVERGKAAFLPAASTMARLAPSLGRRFVGQTLISRFDGLPWRDWAVAELARHHPATMLAHAAALARFSSEPWLDEVDVPTVVVVPTRRPARARRPPAGAGPVDPGGAGDPRRRGPRRVRHRSGGLRRRPPGGVPAGELT